MIDDKKIEEAAERQLDYLGSYGLNEDEIGKIGSMVLYREEDVKESFKAAINWFLDNLWHPASEEPEGYNEGILLHYNIGDYYSLAQVKDFKSWKGFVENMPIDGWLYIDDLFPKEGGEQ